MTTAHTAAEKLERIRHKLASLDFDLYFNSQREKQGLVHDILRMIDDPETKFEDTGEIDFRRFGPPALNAKQPLREVVQ